MDDTKLHAFYLLGLVPCAYINNQSFYKCGIEKADVGTLVHSFDFRTSIGVKPSYTPI